LRIPLWLPFASRSKAKFAALVIAAVLGYRGVAAKNGQIPFRFPALSRSKSILLTYWDDGGLLLYISARLLALRAERVTSALAQFGQGSAKTSFGNPIQLLYIYRADTAMNAQTAAKRKTLYARFQTLPTKTHYV
jgi:hypothetical protein